MSSHASNRQSSKRMGRRPAGSDTRQTILTQARRLFGEQGFKATSLRQIAEAAGVDVALISHYFGNKQGLFDELTQLPFDAESVVQQFLAGERARVGERVVDYLLNHLQEQEDGQQLIALLRSSGGHTEMGAAVKRQYVKGLMEPLARALGSDQPEFRAALAASQLLSLSFAARVLNLDALNSSDTGTLIRVVGATLQRYLVEDLGE